MEWAMFIVAVIGLLALKPVLWPPTEPPIKIESPPPSLEVAIALANNGRAPEALQAFRDLVTADPENAMAHANLCALQLQLNHIAGAGQSCAEALKFKPQYWLAHYNQACVFTLEGRITDAIAALERALTAVASDATAGLSRAGLSQKAASDRMLRPLWNEVGFKRLIGTR
jgi:Flp pilus assembly protein TadD